MLANISQTNPAYFPRTDLLWASPSCTKHSVAQGKRRQDAQPDLFGETLPGEAAERSRATMWDVVRFAEYHQYDAVIVENVVDVVSWTPFRAWQMALESLGYNVQFVYLNSMHAQLFGPGAPQSRDRWYAIATRAAAPLPDVSRIVSPEAVCPECGPIRAVQAWKRPDRQGVGKYRAQYVFRCPNMECRNLIVEPGFRPASDAIDWSLPGMRIGDRERPLADKTMARIQAGIRRYWEPLLVPVEGRDGKSAQPVGQPIRTMTTRSETGIALPPFLAQFRERVRDFDPSQQAMPTVVADGANHGLVAPPFIAELRGGSSDARLASDALGTGHRIGKPPRARMRLLRQRNQRQHQRRRPVHRHHGRAPRAHHAQQNRTRRSRPDDHEAIRTITTTGHRSLIDAQRPTVNIRDVYFRMLEPREIKRAMDFPESYQMLGTRREQVRLAGNAVTPPAARNLVGLVVETLSGGPVARDA